MPSNKLPLASSNPDHVLSIQGRKRHSIIGDGNCLFRALAYIVYGTEDLHAKMRSLLVDFVSKNQPLFQPLVISGKLEEHIQYMLHSRQWGTQVELQAASTLFQMDLYTLRQSPKHTSMAGLGTSHMKLLIFNSLLKTIQGPSMLWITWNHAILVAVTLTALLMKRTFSHLFAHAYPEVTYT